MLTGKIYIMNLPFIDKKGKSKKRPILIWKHEDGIYFYKITSKFINKSDAIRKNYFPIIDWKYANLTKPSYVDLNYKYDVRDFEDFHVDFCGNLSTQDLFNLRNRLNK